MLFFVNLFQLWL